MDILNPVVGVGRPRQNDAAEVGHARDWFFPWSKLQAAAMPGAMAKWVPSPCHHGMGRGSTIEGIKLLPIYSVQSLDRYLLP